MYKEPSPGTHYSELDTPALIIDLDRLQNNINRMAYFFSDRPTALRPHAKTHKCPEIARRQIAAGAIGITCAKTSEAQMLVEGGIHDILIANQVIGHTKIDRLTDLASRANVMVAIDSHENAIALSRACRDKGIEMNVVVEVDIGMKRCGVLPGQDVLLLARQISDTPNICFAGLLAYEGHLVMVQDPQERFARVTRALAPLAETCDQLDQAGLPARIVSGGGTGTYDMTGACPPMTEIEAGSYVFMDTTYLRIRPEFDSALTVLSTVVSRPTPERVITDAGIKSITREFGWPQPVDLPGVTVSGLSEEHGKLLLEDPQETDLGPGDKIRFIPSHCCTTVNLHDRYYVCQNQVLVDLWPIAARGCAQ